MCAADRRYRIELAFEELDACLQPQHFVVHGDQLLLTGGCEGIELLGRRCDESITDQQGLRMRLRWVQAQVDGWFHPDSSTIRGTALCARGGCSVGKHEAKQAEPVANTRAVGGAARLVTACNRTESGQNKFS